MAQVSDLKPRMRFRSDLRSMRGATPLVLTVRPSQDYPDHTRIEVLAKSRKTHILVLPNHQKVQIVGTARKKTSPSAKSRCRCTNHMGNPKISHASEQAALTAIVTRHMKHGAHRVYPCPTISGKYHVTSKRLA